MRRNRNKDRRKNKRKKKCPNNAPTTLIELSFKRKRAKILRENSTRAVE